MFKLFGVFQQPVRPVFSPVTDEEYLKRIFSKGGKELADSRLSGLPAAQKQEVLNQIEKMSIAYYRQNADKYADAYQKAFPQTLDRYFGVLCFSALRDSLLMWAHYADSHKGFVLEFDTENEEFKKLGDLQEIKYDQARPVVDATKPVTMEFYIRKSMEWRYEHEYRLVRHLQACENRSLAGSDFYFVNMPISCVRAVYLGTRMDEALAKQISNLMAGTVAEIYATKLHPQEFSLVFERIK